MEKIPALEKPFELSADNTHIYPNSSGGERIKDLYNLMTGRTLEVIFTQPESAKRLFVVLSLLGYLCNDIDGESFTSQKQ